MSMWGSSDAKQLYADNTAVEYYSGTLNTWIPAKVMHWNADRGANVRVMLKSPPLATLDPPPSTSLLSRGRDQALVG